MKALLIAPAIRPALPQLIEDRPLATVPILGECLLNHWIEHVVTLGARHVIVLSSDRTEDLQAMVGKGERWGARVEIIKTPNEFTLAEAAAIYQTEGKAGWLPEGSDLVVMSHLPGVPERPLFDSYAAWMAAVVGWIPRALTPTRVRVSEVQPGVWVGRRTRIAPSAKLIAPCWIGDQVLVGANAVIGPYAIVEDRSVIEPGAQVIQSYVGVDTFVGRMTVVNNSLALGSTLINWQTDSSLAVPDPFLLCSLARSRHTASPGILARLRVAVGRWLGTWGATSWAARSARTADLKVSG